jgi:phenylacetate-CoA ligase
MSFYNTICEFALKAGDTFLKNGMSSSFDFLMKSQWWTESEIDDYQSERLHKLVNHAFKNVPYYRNLFEEYGVNPQKIRYIADLSKLPLLTKEIIKNNFPDNMVAENISKKQMILGGSSGSTGQPLQYYKTKESLGMLRAANLRGWYWTGFRLGDPYMKIATMPRNSFLKKAQDWLNRSYYVHSRSVSESDIVAILHTLKSKRIKILRGYPGTLYLVATYAEEHPELRVRLDTIVTTSEPLYPHLREKIEAVFACKIFDSYGAEGAPIIFECPTHECYHVSPEIAIVEYIKSDADPNMYKLIYTDLCNYATPFIRYDIGDFAVPADNACSCGRKMPAIKALYGRDTDVLVTPSGKYITFYFFAGYFEHKKYLDFFQMRQVSSSEFILYIVPNQFFLEKELSVIKQDLLEVIGDDVNLTIEVVDDIPLTSSGKRRFFIRDACIEAHI